MGSSDVPLASGPSGSTDSGDRFRDLFVLSFHPYLLRLSQRGGRDGIGSPGPPSPSLATQMASGRAPVEIPGEDVVTCLPVTWRELGFSGLAGPGSFPTLRWKRVSPPKPHGAGSPRENEVVLPEAAEQMLSKQNNRCPLHLRPGKAVCRALCTGQTVIENYLLIRTESKHCPRIPLDKQIQL